MGEIVEPVRAEGEQDLIVVQAPDLLVAVPHAGKVDVDANDGMGAAHGARVHIGQESGDELAPLESKALSGHVVAAVTEHLESELTVDVHPVEVLAPAEIVEFLGQRSCGHFIPGLAGDLPRSREVLMGEDQQYVRVVGDALADLGSNVRTETRSLLHIRRRIPEKSWFLDDIALRQMASKTVVVVRVRVI